MAVVMRLHMSHMPSIMRVSHSSFSYLRFWLLSLQLTYEGELPFVEENHHLTTGEIP